MYQRQILSTSTIQLSYLEWQAAGDPLLLLHGLGDHALVWTSLGNSLSSQFHIVAPDLRGHGETSKPETGYSFTEIIEDLNCLFAHLGWSSAHILGHSWAGKLATIWATRNPEKFRSLILVDPFFMGKIPSLFKLTFPILYRVLPFLQGMGPFPSYEAAQQQAQKLKQYRGWSPLQQQVFQAGIEQKADGRWGSKFTRSARNQIFEEVMRFDGLTIPLRMPALFVKPQQGLNRTNLQLQPYKKYLTHLQIVEVPGNHWAFLVAPQAFEQAIAHFLAELSG